MLKRYFNHEMLTIIIDIQPLRDEYEKDHCRWNDTSSGCFTISSAFSNINNLSEDQKETKWSRI